MRIQLASKTPTEAVPISFDFSGVVSGTIVTSSVAKSTITGTDLNAATLVLGSIVESGGIISLLVSAGVNNCSYELLSTVTDSAGRTWQLAGALTNTTDATT
jgi:hypothetical protein